MPPRSRSLRNRKGRYAKPSKRQEAFAGMSLEQFKRRLPPQLRWMADMDYLDQLSPEQRVWLLTVAETEYRGKAAAEDASPMTREEQRGAANYVRSQATDRRPDLMNYSEEFPSRRREIPQQDSLDDCGEHSIPGKKPLELSRQIYEAMGGKTAGEIEDDLISGIDKSRRKK